MDICQLMYAEFTRGQRECRDQFLTSATQSAVSLVDENIVRGCCHECSQACICLDVLLSTAVLDRTFSLSSVVFLYILSYFVFHCQTGWLNIGLPLTNLSLIDYIASVPCIDTTLYV